jgi:membrane-associated phospholipid phosphatase
MGGRRKKLVLGWCLALLGGSLVGSCWAQEAVASAATSQPVESSGSLQVQSGHGGSSQAHALAPDSSRDARFAQSNAAQQNTKPQAAEKDPTVEAQAQQTSRGNTSTAGQDADSGAAPVDVSDTENALGIRFIRNLALDQKAIWTSPFHLHWGDARWLLPLGEVTAGFLATDPATARAISNDPTTLSHYRSFSNYGVGSLIAAGGGLYVWGRITHDDHKRETGVLAGEAVIDSLVVNSVLEYSFQRERPYQDQGSGLFFHGGTSFPSDHAVAAWSAASVIAHEYPGPLTDLLAYGMATAVSASRVMGKEHYPSDVVVGSAIGWLIGREVYRRHHDPELGGGGWESLEGSEEERSDPQNMGSPFVPLDSWVYPALDRLAALGYISTSYEGMKPWTRIECAHLVEEAAERIAQEPTSKGDADALDARLQQEFAYEFGLFEGQRNLTANLESVYARAVSISGPALTDGYHFGQTVAYDFGRPFERGTNGQMGGAFSAAAGPVTLYVRAEYQHAPSAPAPSAAVINVIALRDIVPAPPDVPVAAIDRPELLDAYLAVNLHSWEISLGRQSFDWGPGSAGAMLWNNNIQPINVVRIVNTEPFELPSFLRFLGPVRIDQFFGRLEGHYFIRRPFILGQKLNFRLLPSLEIGYGRTFEIGGKGQPTLEFPLTAVNFLYGFFGQIRSGQTSIPGHNESEFDWTFYIPKVRNYLVFYEDMNAADDFVPFQNPPKNPFRPGIYLTRFPKIPKLDFHMEAADTESPGFHNPTFDSLEGGPTNHGDLNYWNGKYRDGETYNGFLIGNTVGRDGRAIQAWTNYWLSPRDTLAFTYKHSTVSSDFIPGGGAWQDYTWSNDLYLKSGFYLRSEIQYEHISHYPLLFTGGQQNATAIVEFGFSPRERQPQTQRPPQP